MHLWHIQLHQSSFPCPWNLMGSRFWKRFHNFHTDKDLQFDWQLDQLEVSLCALYSTFPAKKESIVIRDQWNTTNAWLVCQQSAPNFVWQRQSFTIRQTSWPLAVWYYSGPTTLESTVGRQPNTGIWVSCLKLFFLTSRFILSSGYRSGTYLNQLLWFSPACNQVAQCECCAYAQPKVILRSSNVSTVWILHIFAHAAFIPIIT